MTQLTTTSNRTHQFALYMGHFKTGTFTNSQDPDEISQPAVLFVKVKKTFRQKLHLFLKYTMTPIDINIIPPQAFGLETHKRRLICLHHLKLLQRLVRASTLLNFPFFQIIYRSQQRSLCHVELVKLLPLHR